MDANLELKEYETKSDTIYLYVKSKNREIKCTYCGEFSNKVHSKYTRSFQDLPIQDKKTIIVLENRKMFCKNKDCNKKTFSEKFSFLANKAKKTKRLEEEIIGISKNLSTIKASKTLKENSIEISKSTVNNILKKNSNSNK